MMVYMGSTLHDLRQKVGFSLVETRKLHERVDIYKELAKHEAQLKYFEEVMKQWKR